MKSSMSALPPSSALVSTECLTRPSTPPFHETVMMRQLRKGGLCSMIEDGKLPPLHSPDCDLLFKLDEPECPSRLHATSPPDSPFVDQSAWGVGYGAGETETWLPRTAVCCAGRATKREPAVDGLLQRWVGRYTDNMGMR